MERTNPALWRQHTYFQGCENYLENPKIYFQSSTLFIAFACLSALRDFCIWVQCLSPLLGSHRRIGLRGPARGSCRPWNGRGEPLSRPARSKEPLIAVSADKTTFVRILRGFWHFAGGPPIFGGTRWLSGRKVFWRKKKRNPRNNHSPTLRGCQYYYKCIPLMCTHS